VKRLAIWSAFLAFVLLMNINYKNDDAHAGMHCPLNIFGADKTTQTSFF
jgi:hypothetical protein